MTDSYNRVNFKLYIEKKQLNKEDDGTYIVQIELSDDSESNRMTILDFAVDIQYHTEYTNYDRNEEE